METPPAPEALPHAGGRRSSRRGLAGGPLRLRRSHVVPVRIVRPNPLPSPAPGWGGLGSWGIWPPDRLLPAGWELRGAPHSPGPLPTADRRGGTDGQPATPPLRPHREAAAQAATRLQHPLPVQGPRPAANVRGECVQPPHPGPHPTCPSSISPGSHCLLGLALL